MPIFDQGYQHWDGKLSGHGWRWLAITRRGVKTGLKSRWTRVALILAWIPAVALGVFLALWGLFEQKADDFRGFFAFLPEAAQLDPKAFRASIWTLAFGRFLHFETFAAMVLVVIVGPSLISEDLRFNAMPLYLSRPLRRFDYFAGKLGTIAAFLAAVMIVPCLLTYLLGVGFSLGFGVIRDTYRIVPACLAYGALVVLVFGLFMLAISSLSKNSRYVAAVWIGIWLVGSFSANVLGTGLQLKWGPIVSVVNDVEKVGDVLLGADQAWEPLGKAFASGMARPGPFGRAFAPAPPPPPPNPFSLDFPVSWAVYVILGLMGLSLWVLSTRVKSLDRLR